MHIKDTIAKLILLFITALAIAFGLSVFVFILFVLLDAGNLHAYLSGGPFLGEKRMIMKFILHMAQSAGLIGAVLILYRHERWESQGWSLGWKERTPFRHALLGSFIGLVFIGIAVLFTWLSGHVHIFQFTVLGSEPLSVYAWMNLVMLIVIAVSEEVFCRGYVQGLLMHRFGSLAGIIGSSAVFTLVHWYNHAMFDSILPVLNLFLTGLLLGICRAAANGLWLPVGIHVTWTVLYDYIFRSYAGGAPAEGLMNLDMLGAIIRTVGGFAVEGRIITMGFLLISILIADRWMHHNRRMWTRF